MIQKFTCVPKCDYDVIVVSNGSHSQMQSKLIEISRLSNNEIYLHSNITYLSSITSLVSHLNNKIEAPDGIFHGKVIFMYFHGLNFIQDFICESIEYNGKFIFGSQVFDRLENVYFYFDSSIVSNDNNSNCSFVMLITIVNDIVKNLDFMIDRIRNIYIDDLQMMGERRYGLRTLIRNYPNIEKISLSSYTNLMMKDIVT